MNGTMEISVEQLIERDTIAFLKGMVVGHSLLRGMKWASTKKMTPAFELGLQISQKDKWVSKEKVTLTHILHNRKRHNRPHTGSVDNDNFFFTPDCVIIISRMNTHLNEYIKKTYNKDLYPDGTGYANKGVTA